MKLLSLVTAVASAQNAPDAAPAADKTAVNKVIELVRALQEKVVVEGKHEASTYEKYACFCKDQTKIKSKNIQEGSTELGSLEGKLSAKLSDRDGFDIDIHGYSRDIQDDEQAKADEIAAREAEHRTFQKNFADLESALSGLTEAIKTLQSSRNKATGENSQIERADRTGHHFASLIATGVRKAVIMAEVLGVNIGPTNLDSFLQEDPLINEVPAVPEADYDYHSNDIIQTLQNLHKDFLAKRDQIVSEEEADKAASDSIVQNLVDYIRVSKEALAESQKNQNITVEEIGNLNADLTIVTANLHDDQNYLKDLTAKCNAKQAAYTQRSTMRSDEVAALSQALDIIESEVTANTTDRTVRLTQASSSFTQITQARNHKQRGHLTAPIDQRMERISQLFSAKSKLLKSGLLATLAKKASHDPLDKVKTLIQELIDRLQAEAAGEANHAGWCNTETARSERQRDSEAGKVKDLNARLADLEARGGDLAMKVQELFDEIADLDLALGDARQQRTDEELDNNNAIMDAENGRDAVDSAVMVLEHFYKAAKKAKLSLTQQPVAEMPDAGFDNEAYTGSQGASKGIIGMLQTIRGDFVRTISDTKVLEKQQAADFLAYKTETQSSIDKKQTAHDTFDSEHTDVLGKISVANTDLDLAQRLLEEAVTALVELHQSCVAGGQSYKERKANREDEIAALKQALCILSKEGPFKSNDCL